MISAILLAAGESRRMGRLKQLLSFGESTIIRAAINNLINAKIDELIVVLGHRADEIREHLSGLPIRIVINEAYQTGMTSSVQTGLMNVDPRARAIMLALVDQPQIPTEIIDRLIECYYQSGALIVKPRYQNSSGHPIIIDLTLRDEVMRLTPLEGLNTVTRAYQTETYYLSVDTPAVLEDIDTPEDYLKQLR